MDTPNSIPDTGNYEFAGDGTSTTLTFENQGGGSYNAMQRTIEDDETITDFTEVNTVGPTMTTTDRDISVSGRDNQINFRRGPDGDNILTANGKDVLNIDNIQQQQVAGVEYTGGTITLPEGTDFAMNVNRLCYFDGFRFYEFTRDTINELPGPGMLYYNPETGTALYSINANFNTFLDNTISTIATDAPITDAPITDAPITDAPITDAPITDAPITDALITDAPITDAPITDAPITEPPSTDAPSTDPPSTDPPSTDVLVTQEPPVVTEEEKTPKSCSKKCRYYTKSRGKKGSKSKKSREQEEADDEYESSCRRACRDRSEETKSSSSSSDSSRSSDSSSSSSSSDSSSSSSSSDSSSSSSSSDSSSSSSSSSSSDSSSSRSSSDSSSSSSSSDSSSSSSSSSSSEQEEGAEAEDEGEQSSSKSKKSKRKG